MKRLRWGILSTAGIARKNWKAIFHTGNAIVTAVASRDLKLCRQFVAECQRDVPFEVPPEALGSYEALLASANVDAVYVPLPTGVRREWILSAAAAGKHVVGEKPCARNAAELAQMLDACSRNRVQFMDGVMFMHSRRLHRIREVLDDGRSIGRIKRIGIHFSFCGDETFLRENIRVNSELEPHGCLGDLGWYCIRFALWAMKWQLPRAVTGRILSRHQGARSPSPVPTEFSAELQFEDGASAGFYCSFLTENQQLACVSGTRGYLELADFVLPYQGPELAFEVHNAVFRSEGCTFELTPNTRRVVVAEHAAGHPTAQETNLFRNFSDLVLSGRLDPHWPDIALKTQTVLDACLVSAGDNSRLVTL